MKLIAAAGVNEIRQGVLLMVHAVQVTPSEPFIERNVPTHGRPADRPGRRVSR